jgi:hypothetical protein
VVRIALALCATEHEKQAIEALADAAPQEAAVECALVVRLPDGEDVRVSPCASDAVGMPARPREEGMPACMRDMRAWLQADTRSAAVVMRELQEAADVPLGHRQVTERTRMRQVPLQLLAEAWGCSHMQARLRLRPLQSAHAVTECRDMYAFSPGALALRVCYQLLVPHPLRTLEMRVAYGELFREAFHAVLTARY